MPEKPDELWFSFLTLKVAAKGRVSFIIGGAVSLLIAAVAWRLVT